MTRESGLFASLLCILPIMCPLSASAQGSEAREATKPPTSVADAQRKPGGDGVRKTGTVLVGERTGNTVHTALPASIGVVDFRRVTRESAAGKNLRAIINARRRGFEKEIRDKRETLEKLHETLRRAQKDTPEEVMLKRYEDYANKKKELEQLVQSRKRQLDELFANGMRILETELVDILKQIAKERGLSLILNAAKGEGVVIFADQETIITGEALKRLDRRLNELSVEPKTELR